MRNSFTFGDKTSFSFELYTDLWADGTRVFYGYRTPEDSTQVAIWGKNVDLHIEISPEGAPMKGYTMPEPVLPAHLKEQIVPYESAIAELELRVIPAPSPEMEEEYAKYYDADTFYELMRKATSIWKDKERLAGERRRDVFPVLTEMYRLIAGIQLPGHLRRDDGRFATVLSFFFSILTDIVKTADGEDIPDEVTKFYNFLDLFLDELIVAGNRLHGLERSMTPKEEGQLSELEDIIDSENKPLEKRLRACEKAGANELLLPADRIDFYRRAIELITETVEPENMIQSGEVPDELAPHIELIRSQIDTLEGEGETYWTKLISERFLENANLWMEGVEGFDGLTAERFAKAIYLSSIHIETDEKDGTLNCTTELYFRETEDYLAGHFMVAQISGGKVDFNFMG